MFGDEIFGNSLLIIYKVVKNLYLTVINSLELGRVEIRCFFMTFRFDPHRVFEILVFVDLHTDINFSKLYTTINAALSM